MPLWPGFSSGGTYQALSPIIGADEAWNIFSETRGQGSAKQTTFYGTPGLLNVGTVATTGCRGWFTQDDLTVVVVGATLYTVTFANPLAPIFTAVAGTIANDGFPVSYASNGAGGDQLAIVGGGELQILDLNALTLSGAIALPFGDPGMVVFIDGYFLINDRGTPTVWFSALEDGTSWDALDFFTRSGTSDNVVGLAVSKSRVWVLGSQTSTLFYDSGDTDTPFLPFPESVTQWGLVSQYALDTDGDIVYWLAQRQTGTPQVVRATADPAPNVLSSPPIDLLLEGASSHALDTLFVYSQGGHTFVCLTCPGIGDNGETLCCDVAEQGNPWHKRGDWNEGTGWYQSWRVAGCCMVGQRIYVGDAQTGDLYMLRLDVYDNDGDILRAIRRAPYLGAEAQWGFIDQVELGTQAGTGLVTGQGSDPVVTLKISRDGAQTWDDQGFGSIGVLGDYDARCMWTLCGRARLDRLVFEVSQTDPTKRVFGPGMWLRISQGTGQL